MKIVFMGTPEFALPALQKVIEKHDVVCVYTRAPKPKGRGNKFTSTVVEDYAKTKEIEVRTPKTLRNNHEEWEYLKSLKADIAVIVAYGLILPKEVIDIFPYGGLNIHGSLLPKWRGSAPIERSMMALDDETGITIMQIDEGLDTGDMLLKASYPIDDEVTGEFLREKLSVIGAELMQKVLDDLKTGSIKREKQPDKGISHALKIEKSERLLDFNEEPRNILRKIKAIGGYFVYKDEVFNILDASLADTKEKQTGKILSDLNIVLNNDKVLKIKLIQRQGKKAMDDKSFLCGFNFDEGTVL